MKYKLRCL